MNKYILFFLSFLMALVGFSGADTTITVTDFQTSGGTVQQFFADLDLSSISAAEVDNTRLATLELEFTGSENPFFTLTSATIALDGQPFQTPELSSTPQNLFLFSGLLQHSEFGVPTDNLSPLNLVNANNVTFSTGLNTSAFNGTLSAVHLTIPTTVPEPSTFFLLLAGSVALFYHGKGKRA